MAKAPDFIDVTVAVPVTIRVPLTYGSPVHACPPGSSGIMPCCRRTPFEVPRTDRMTLDDDKVTCRGTVGA